MSQVESQNIGVLALRTEWFSLGFELEMSFRFSRFGLWMVLALFAICGPAVSHVHAQGKPQPRRAIELSETNSAEILTNLNQLTTKKDGFRQLDEQLKSLKGISPGNSMESRFTAPYVSPTTPVLPRKAIKELLDRKKNWGLTPEQLGAVSSTSDSDSISVFGEDKSDNKKSSLEQFYNALNHQGKGFPSADQSKDDGLGVSSKRGDSRNDTASDDDSKLPRGVRDQTQRLKELVNEDPSSVFVPARAHTSFENFFGLDVKTVTPEQSPTPKTSMESFVDQFKRVLDSPAAAANLDPTLSSLAPADAARRTTAVPGLETQPITTHHELTQSTPGNLTPSLNRTTLPDLNATVLNQWNPMYQPPKVQLPKVTPPTPPNLDFPRRRF